MKFLTWENSSKTGEEIQSRGIPEEEQTQSRVIPRYTPE